MTKLRRGEVSGGQVPASGGDWAGMSPVSEPHFPAPRPPRLSPAGSAAVGAPPPALPYPLTPQAPRPASALAALFWPRPQFRPRSDASQWILLSFSAPWCCVSLTMLTLAMGTWGLVYLPNQVVSSLMEEAHTLQLP